MVFGSEMEVDFNAGVVWDNVWEGPLQVRKHASPGLLSVESAVP